MATPLRIENMFTVLVISSDDEKRSMFQLSSDTAVSELKRLWESTYNLPSGCIMRRVDRSRLLDHETMLDVGELAPGTRTVNVLVETSINVSIRCLVEEDIVRREISLGLSQTPEDLHPRIREIFDLDEDHVFRLTRDHSPLTYGLSFEYQSLETDDVLCVDLGTEFDVWVQLYGESCPGRRSITVNTSQLLQQLHPHIREVFQLGDDRYFRLRGAEAGLSYHSTLGELALTSDDVLFVDLGYKLEVIDAWTSSVERRLLFSSEQASDLKEENEERILVGGVEVRLEGELLNALPETYRRMTDIALQRKCQRDITFLVNSFLKQKLVWPKNLLGKVIQGCPPLQDKDFFFEAQRLSKKFKQLPDHALLHTQTRVEVKLRDGKWRMFRLPEMATVADLEAVVSVTEGGNVSLSCGGRLLDGGEKVKALADGGSFEVERRHTVIVSLSDRSVRFNSEQPTIRFTALMRQVAASSKIHLKDLVETPFECRGCGRRITLEEEAFQTIPADCCRVRSLCLEDATPVKTKDIATQGCWRMREKKSGYRGKSCGRRTQTRPKRTSSIIQSPRRLTRGVKQQTSRQRTGTSMQHPPPQKFPFYVLDQRDQIVSNRIYLMYDLLLSDKPTGGQVRVALAESLKVSPTTFRLQRKSGQRKRDGQRVFHAFDDRIGWDGFADTVGNRCRSGDVTSVREYVKGSDPFFLIPGARNVVWLRTASS